MFERSVGFVASRALPVSFVAQIHRMLKLSVLARNGFSAERLVERRVADVAIVSDNFSFFAEMLSVVAPETALNFIMPDIIGVCLPIGFHFREKIRLINSLNFRNRAAD